MKVTLSRSSFSPATKVVAPQGSPYKADYYTTGTNDNVAIQAAITALPASGGLIFLREGSYTIGASVLLNKSNISLVGVGWGTKLTLANGVNDHMIKVTGTGTKKIVVKSLQLQGNSANQTAFSSDGININTPWQDPGPDPDHLFEDLDIFDFANNGFTVQPHDTRILNCNRVKTRLNRGWGFYIEGTDESYTNCIADEGMQGGFYCGNYNLRFVNCFAFWCSQNNSTGGGFHFANQNSYLTGCESQNDYYDGFYIEAGSNTNTLVNCVGDSNGQNGTGRGIRILGTTNQVIGGGFFHYTWYTGWTQQYGISLEGSASGNAISSVMIYGNTNQYSDTSTGGNYFQPLIPTIVTKTAAYTITPLDTTVLANAVSAGFTVTLPNAITCSGRQYTIKKTDSSTNLVTIATTSSQTIDGITTRLISAQYQSIIVQSNGTGWNIINNEGYNAQSPSGSIASANNLSLPGYCKYFPISGTTQINLIDATNFAAGSMITLRFQGNITIKNNQAASGNNKSIILNGGVDFSAADGYTLTLAYDGVGNAWFEVARKI